MKNRFRFKKNTEDWNQQQRGDQQFSQQQRGDQNQYQQNGFQGQIMNQEPIFQRPADPVYTSNDSPIVSEESKRFTKNELNLQITRTALQLTFAILLTLAFSVVIGIFVVNGYTFSDGITASINVSEINGIMGIDHLGWMATLGILSLFLFLYFAMKVYGIRKDLTRLKAYGQNDGYVPLSLKKHYRALRSNNTYIHYFAFLTYFLIGMAILIIYLIDGDNEIFGRQLVYEPFRAQFEPLATYLGISAAVVFAVHFLWVFFRIRKANVYDAKFGKEIVSKEEILALKKRNRKVCIFLTILFTIIGVAVFYIIKKLVPSLKLPSLLKK